jgi:hypothetical protein
MMSPKRRFRLDFTTTSCALSVADGSTRITESMTGKVAKRWAEVRSSAHKIRCGPPGRRVEKYHHLHARLMTAGSPESIKNSMEQTRHSFDLSYSSAKN